MLLKPNVNMNSSNTLFLQAGNDLWYHIANAYRWQRIPFPNFKIQQAPATPQRGIAFTLFSCFVHNTGPVAQTTLARASSFSKQDNTSTLCEHDGAQCNTHTHCVRLSLTHTLSLSLCRQAQKRTRQRKKRKKKNSYNGFAWSMTTQLYNNQEWSHVLSPSKENLMLKENSVQHLRIYDCWSHFPAT